MRNSRCSWAGTLVAVIAASVLPLAPGSARSASPYKIGVINEAWAANHPAVEGLKEGLRELGFVEGSDVVYDIHFTRGKPGAADDAAKALLKAGVNLIFTSDDAPTLAAKKATKQIPIVFTLVGDPVAIGLVNTLAYPGGNVTGISSRTTDLAPKRLEMLKYLVPNLHRVWFIYYSGDITDAAARRSLNDVAGRLGLELLSRPVNDAAKLKEALGEMRPGDGILSPSSNILDIPVSILETGLSAGVPAVFTSTIWVSNGGVISYGPEFRAQGLQAARLVAKILRGVKPQDIPVEGAEHISLALNVKTAARLGLPVPRTMVFRANAIYQ